MPDSESAVPADAPGLTTYGEIIEVVTNLRIIVREARRRDRLSQREVCRRTGLNSSTMSRFESGEGVSVEAVVALLRWLDSPRKEKTDA